jgi:adenylosuccinate synthase
VRVDSNGVGLLRSRRLMSVTVIIGGQYGSEGKGKVALEFARRQRATVAVRVGGTNSGHTAVDANGVTRILRQLPTAALLPDVICVLPAGAYIDPDVLLGEIAAVGLPAHRLVIDPNAALITNREKTEEAQSGLREKIGSTGSGTGAGVARRIGRDGTTRFVGSDHRLQPYLPETPTVQFMRTRLARRERVIIEGTQGFGLSLLHSDAYPNVTSRDTSAAAFVSEAGLSPLDVDQVVLVLRSYPIRVAGNSGELLNEIDWSTVTTEAGAPVPISERTSVTRMVRRVARFDAAIVRRAIETNMPTHIVMNHLDYVDYACRSKNGLTCKATEFVRRVESEIRAPVTDLGFGPDSLIARQEMSDFHGEAA